MLKGILKTIWMVVYVSLYFLFSLLLWVRVKWLEMRGKDTAAREMVNQIAANWGRRTVKATGSRVEVKGSDNLPEGPVLVTSNHQGAMDIPLLVGYIDKGLAFIAKKELKKIPILATWMRQLKCILIDRSDIRQTLKAFQNAGDVFAAGQSLVVFPEGTRSKSSKLGRFKRGSFKVALQHDIPILPVTIKDSYKIWEGNEDGLIQRADVEITISEPIYPDQLSDEEKNNLKERVRETIKSNLD